MSQDRNELISGYDISAEEIQNLLNRWVRTTEVFLLRCASLQKNISSLKSVARKKPGDQVRLDRLIKLNIHSNDVLMSLIVDMSGQRSESSLQSSKPGRLYSHACLLDELNREIDAELFSSLIVAQA